MSATTNIAITPGDGIGPEVVKQAVHCLEILRQRYKLDLGWHPFPWPSHDWHQQHGESMPADALEQLCADSTIVDARSKLETQAYAYWITGKFFQKNSDNVKKLEKAETTTSLVHFEKKS